ncbi:NAD(P)-binding domain-containing protein [Aliarcobacter butzleri]|uniref:NAD(P)-binding domain-containing protein n=1 Tax=Aliarcobacter butzleri TaxID=28197 RepID=UPI00263F426D|nr:NAD(P)-binding domain-containing protein [Aliarcobacter butzleri]MDN5073635.1 NAD(P)-binding domain-containing protein [Aliarcobacter butzleri]MDN5120580.1 NAD(P)-binding domain-containing protein [Aliarcobacter butzleri]
MNEKIYDIIVIGAGSAGIACIIEAKFKNIENILLIEKTSNHSETIRKFYKDGKRVDKDWKNQVIKLEGNIDFMDGTKESTLEYFEELLNKNEISPIYNTEVEKIIKNENTNLFEVHTLNKIYQTKFAIICIGKMGKPNKPDYKIPTNIKKYINFNLDDCTTNEKILVIGGGNSAAEYAYFLTNEKNNVTLAYRKPTFTRLNPINEKLLMQYQNDKKLTIKMNKEIKKLEEANNLKIKVIYTDEEIEIFDRLIYAIGGTTPIDFLKACDVKIDENLNPICDGNFESSTKGIYLAGDIASKGEGSISMALNHGYHIIKDISAKNV